MDTFFIISFWCLTVLGIVVAISAFKDAHTYWIHRKFSKTDFYWFASAVHGIFMLAFAAACFVFVD